MTEEEFLQEENEFLTAVRESALYRRTKELSDKIDQDPRLCSLAKQRDDFYERSAYAESEEKQKLLLEFKRLDDGLRNDPLVSEYLACYQEMRKILGHLSNLFAKELQTL